MGSSSTESLASSLNNFALPTQFMNSLVADQFMQGDKNGNDDGESEGSGFSWACFEESVMIDGGERVLKSKGVGPPSISLNPNPSPVSISASSFIDSVLISPTDQFLDYSALLSTPKIPTSPGGAGRFMEQALNWRGNSRDDGPYPNVKDEEAPHHKRPFDFSFRPQTSSSFAFGSQNRQQEAWNIESPTRKSGYLRTNVIGKTDFAAVQRDAATQTQPPTQPLREERRGEDGYSWRKYGQKQVKGS